LNNTQHHPPRRRRRAKPRKNTNNGKGFVIVLLLALIIILIFVFNPNNNNTGINNESNETNSTNNTTTNTQSPSSPNNTATPEQPPFSLPGSNITPDTNLRDNHSKILWLDAGHGGGDPGALAVHNGVTVYERDIVLQITLLAYEMFQASDSGITVFLTRHSNECFLDLPDRELQARYRFHLWNNHADFVISIHADSFEDPSVHGLQVYYYAAMAENTGRFNVTRHNFAQILQTHLIRETGARDRSTRGDARISPIIANSTMPTVIIETGFMTNPDELALLVSHEYQYSIARAIYLGAREAFGIN